MLAQRRVVCLAAAAALVMGVSACGGDSGTPAPGGGGATSTQAAPALEGVGPITLVHRQGHLGQPAEPGRRRGTSSTPASRSTPDRAAGGRRPAAPADGAERSDQVRRLHRAEHRRGLDRGVRREPLDRAAARGAVPAATRCCQRRVETGKYFNSSTRPRPTSDGGLLYYRKDLLDAAGVTKAPATWAEMKAACAEGKGQPTRASAATPASSRSTRASRSTSPRP